MADLDQLETEKQENLILWQIQRDAINSQLTDLREELEDYEALIESSPDQPLVMTFQSLSELPTALIKARIAAKLSQKALADQLGLKEQQIQRYEATEYASANPARIIKIQ
ncbi:MAG: helix-turn-helix transcriptional regulator [Thermosynechococcaceae cyanobacterium]